MDNKLMIAMIVITISGAVVAALSRDWIGTIWAVNCAVWVNIALGLERDVAKTKKALRESIEHDVNKLKEV